jgi:signal transduction histidine kinase/putative methionine-R-sulfoxide reductase with GAF domain
MTTDTLQQLKSILRQKEKELYSIQKIGQALSSTLNIDDLLNLVMKEITFLMNADRSTLYLVDRRKKEIWSKIALKAEVKEIRQKFGKGISGYVAETGQKINIPDAYHDSRFDPSTDKRTGYRTRSILCIPVWEPLSMGKKPKLMAVIQVLNKKNGTFTQEDEGILEAIGSEVSIALANARLYEQLKKKFNEIDLLYDFEQKLSGVYQINEILQSILLRTVQTLRTKKIAIIYPIESKNYLLSVDEKNQVKSEIFPEIDEEILPPEILTKPQRLRKIENAFKREIKKYIDPELKIFRILPLIFREDRVEFAALVLSSQVETGKSTSISDNQIIGIVEQKISRALELSFLRERIIKQERLFTVGQMMSTIVHDLRSPLNTISGFLELMLEKETTPTEKKDYSNIIRLEIQSIANMTREILDFAKGKTSILPRKISVIDIIKRFQMQAEQLFRNTDILVKFENESKRLIYADAEKIARVLYNIAKNAKEALKGRGEFLFRSFDENGKVVFQISDNGPGIPEDIRDRLFESFVTSGKESGTGLGLAIAKKIIDEHEGKIEIQSGRNKGTTFFIKIPEYQKEKKLI